MSSLIIETGGSDDAIVVDKLSKGIQISIYDSAVCTMNEVRLNLQQIDELKMWLNEF